MWKTLSASLLVFCLGAVATPATAQTYTASTSSESAADQYAETIPEVDGEDLSGAKPGAGGAEVPDTTTPARFQDLESQGGLGADAARVATATAPTPDDTEQSNKSQGGNKDRGDKASTAQVNDAIDYGEYESNSLGVVSAMSNTGLGLLFPIVMIAALAGAALIAIRRRQH